MTEKPKYIKYILDAYINIYINALETELFFEKLFGNAYEVFYFNKG